MDVAELMAIVNAEQLDMPVLNSSDRLHSDAVVMQEDGLSRKVFLVDERHQVIATTVRSFATESDALEHVLRKLRQVRRSRQSSDALNASEAKEPHRSTRQQRGAAAVDEELSRAIIEYLAMGPRRPMKTPSWRSPETVLRDARTGATYR